MQLIIIPSHNYENEKKKAKLMQKRNGALV
jgi:hypothetical protein